MNLLVHFGQSSGPIGSGFCWQRASGSLSWEHLISGASSFPYLSSSYDRRRHHWTSWALGLSLSLIGCSLVPLFVSLLDFGWRGFGCRKLSRNGFDRTECQYQAFSLTNCLDPVQSCDSSFGSWVPVLRVICFQSSWGWDCQRPYFVWAYCGRGKQRRRCCSRTGWSCEDGRPFDWFETWRSRALSSIAATVLNLPWCLCRVEDCVGDY